MFLSLRGAESKGCYSPEQNCLPNTLSLTLPNINSGELMNRLDYSGIAVSAGSACSSQLNRPSHVLIAIGLSEKTAQEPIRISLGIDTSLKDIKYTSQVFAKILEELDSDSQEKLAK